MLSAGLSIERTVTPGLVTFALTGALDLDAVGNVEAILGDDVDAVCHDVAVDLSRLGSIGVAGVELLVALARRLAVQDRRLRVVATNDVVDRVFDQARVHVVADDETPIVFVTTRRSSRVPGPERAPNPGHDSLRTKTIVVPDRQVW